MKVIFVCDTAEEVNWIEGHRDELTQDLGEGVWWPQLVPDFTIEAQRAKPSREELLGLLRAMGGEPTPEERDAWMQADLEDQARRPGSGVYRA